MITKKETNLISEKVECKCDVCGKIFRRIYGDVIRSRKRRNSEIDQCVNCACKAPKPQWTNWTPERRKKHSEAIKNSKTFQEGRKKKEPIIGPKNPMYGKKHTAETKAKMSAVRKGRTGPKSGSWRGGRSSLSERVRGLLHNRFGWYLSVYKRDGFKCKNCGSNKKLDAHHIKPLSTIIQELLEKAGLGYELENLEWVCSQPEIIDKSLNNGITLCRLCHKQWHENWGSHNAKSNGENAKL